MLNESESKIIIDQLIDDFICITAFCSVTERLLKEHPELEGTVFTNKEKQTMIETIMKTASRRKDIEEILKKEGAATFNSEINSDEVGETLDKWKQKKDTRDDIFSLPLLKNDNKKILH